MGRGAIDVDDGRSRRDRAIARRKLHFYLNNMLYASFPPAILRPEIERKSAMRVFTTGKLQEPLTAKQEAAISFGKPVASAAGEVLTAEAATRRIGACVEFLELAAPGETLSRDSAMIDSGRQIVEMTYRALRHSRSP